MARFTPRTTEREMRSAWWDVKEKGAMKYRDRQLAGLSARPPDRVELIGAGSLGYGTGPSQLRLRADKLPSPNH